MHTIMSTNEDDPHYIINKQNDILDVMGSKLDNLNEIGKDINREVTKQNDDITDLRKTVEETNTNVARVSQRAIRFLNDDKDCIKLWMLLIIFVIDLILGAILIFT